MRFRGFQWHHSAIEGAGIPSPHLGSPMSRRTPRRWSRALLAAGATLLVAAPSAAASVPLPATSPITASGAPFTAALPQADLAGNGYEEREYRVTLTTPKVYRLTAAGRPDRHRLGRARVAVRRLPQPHHRPRAAGSRRLQRRRRRRGDERHDRRGPRHPLAAVLRVLPAHGDDLRRRRRAAADAPVGDDRAAGGRLAARRALRRAGAEPRDAGGARRTSRTRTR